MCVFQICQFRDSVRTRQDYDIEQEVPFMWKDDSWVGYEDTKSARVKVFSQVSICENVRIHTGRPIYKYTMSIFRKSGISFVLELN